MEEVWQDAVDEAMNNLLGGQFVLVKDGVTTVHAAKSVDEMTDKLRDILGGEPMVAPKKTPPQSVDHDGDS